jgi:hypothetical protein
MTEHEAGFWQGNPPDAMQEVFCDEDGCGVSLGYQGAGEIQRDHWRHNRCPERIARDLNMSRKDYDQAVGTATVAIAGAYPDFPNGDIDNRSKEVVDVRVLRARIAAECVMECLTVVGFTMGKR